MKTNKILLIFCLALLGLVLIASMFKKVPGIVKNGSFFIAIVLLAVSQVLGYIDDSELYKDWCDGNDPSKMEICEDEMFSNYSSKTLSLCIPCIPKHVNHLKDLSKNINEQTVLPDEVVIAISNSDRDTKNQIRKIFQNLRTKLIITDVSHKALAGENRNRAVKFATSDIVSFMDADDLMHKQRIEILKYHFNKSNAIAIFHKFKYGNPTGKINVKNIKLDSDILIKAHKDKSTIYLKINDITHGHVSCLRSIFNKLKQDIKNTERREDSKFARDLMDNFDQKRIYLINENLSNYRHQFSSQY